MLNEIVADIHRPQKRETEGTNGSGEGDLEDAVLTCRWHY